MPQPFSYYGGKQRLASKIIPLIPRHTVYVEPFAGGASLFWNKPWPKVTNAHHYREVLNDTNKLISNFYTVLRDDFDALVQRIERTEHGQSVYAEARNICKSLDASPLVLAWAFYVNIQQSFANKLYAGWGMSKYTCNRAAMWAGRDLLQFTGRLREVHIGNEDAIDCIKRWNSPQTFFYCDPPYPNTNQGHYSGYTLDDFNRLIETLDACEGSFILSCYPQEGIPNTWERFDFDATMSAAKKKDVEKKRTEVVWRRFNHVPVQPEIQKLYDSGAFDCFAFPASERQQPDLFTSK